MSVKQLTEYNLEFLSLKGGCTGLSESTLVKIPHCWKSHVTAHNIFLRFCFCIFESDTVKSDCPMQENYKIFKDLIQTVGLLY